MVSGNGGEDCDAPLLLPLPNFLSDALALADVLDAEGRGGDDGTDRRRPGGGGGGSRDAILRDAIDDRLDSLSGLFRPLPPPRGGGGEEDDDDDDDARRCGGRRT